jgi:hypothetical protein
MDLLDQMDLLVTLDPMVHKEERGRLGMLEIQDLAGQKDLRDTPEIQDFAGQKGLQDTQEIQDLAEVRDLLDTLEVQGRLVRRATMARLVLRARRDLLDQLEDRVQPDLLEALEVLEILDQLVQTDLRVRLEAPVHLALPVLPVLLEAPVVLVRKV